MASPPQPTLQGETLDHLTPFHIHWNNDGQVQRLSPKAKTLFGLQGCPDGNLKFKLVKPFRVTLTAALFPELTHMILMLGHSNSTCVLKGELIQLSGQSGWLFSGMPPFESLVELEELGFQLNELPIHMGLGNLLLANEAARISVTETLKTNKELVKASQALKERSEDLEQRSYMLALESQQHQQAKRQLEETLRELKQAQRVLVQQERLRALGEMVSGIAHDFNNTLTPIMAYCAIMEDEEITAQERSECLQIIRTAAEDAAAMIQRLRGLYKPNHTKGELVSFSINRVIEDAVALARPRFLARQKQPNQSIQIDRELNAEGHIQGAEADIRQAILNLLMNAVDALTDTPRIEIHTQSSQTHVFVSIRDHGSGMSPDNLARCRHPFFSTKGERGTGLGLPMAIQTVARQGGELELKSAQGHGTTVTLSLPRNPKATALTQESLRIPALKRTDPSQPPPSHTTPTAQLASERLSVLLIDDDPVVLRAFKRAIENEGHSVVSTDKSQEVLELLSAQRFDMVLSDVNMPKLRGDDLAAQIRTRYPNAIVILYTGDPDSINSAGRRAADAIFGKPIAPRTILQDGFKHIQLRQQLQ